MAESVVSKDDMERLLVIDSHLAALCRENMGRRNLSFEDIREDAFILRLVEIWQGVQMAMTHHN